MADNISVGKAPQQIQFENVAEGKAPDLSKMDDEEALALLMIQRTNIIKGYVSSLEKDQLTLNNAINKVSDTANKLNDIIEQPAKAVVAGLKAIPPLDPNAYGNNGQNMPDPADWAQVAPSVYNKLKTNIKASPETPTYVVYQARDGKFYRLPYEYKAEIDSQPTLAGKQKIFGIYFRTLLRGTSAPLVSIGGFARPSEYLFDKSGFNSVIDHIDTQKMDPPFFSKDFTDPAVLKQLSDLGLTFPPDSSSDEGVRKLLTQVSTQKSALNQNMQDMTRAVTKNNYYLNQYTQMASQMEMNHSSLIHTFINGLVF